MEKNIIITSFKSEDFQKLIKDSVSSTIIDALSDLRQKEDTKGTNELLSRKDVAGMYGVSYVTLRSWEKDKIIPKPIRKGSRVYWRKSDVMSDINKKEDGHV